MEGRGEGKMKRDFVVWGGGGGRGVWDHLAFHIHLAHTLEHHLGIHTGGAGLQRAQHCPPCRLADWCKGRIPVSQVI